MTSTALISPTPPVRLLDQVRDRIRVKHDSLRTERAHVDWVRRYVVFHGKRHPRDLSPGDVEAFLSDLAVRRHVSASTQNQAEAALLFSLPRGARRPVPWLDEIVKAHVARRLPVVLAPREVKALLDGLNGTTWLVASLLFGTGMRLLGGLRLRVKGVEFEGREIVVCKGKGNQDRVTVLPENLLLPLRDPFAQAKRLHDADLAAGYGDAEMPHARDLMFPRPGREWGWQYCFRPRNVRSIRAPASSAVIICSSRTYSAR